MSNEDDRSELLLLEQFLKEIRDFRAEMRRQFEEMTEDIRSLSRKVDSLHEALNGRESRKEIPEELVN